MSELAELQKIRKILRKLLENFVGEQNAKAAD